MSLFDLISSIFDTTDLVDVSNQPNFWDVPMDSEFVGDLPVDTGSDYVGDLPVDTGLSPDEPGYGGGTITSDTPSGGGGGGTGGATSLPGTGGLGKLLSSGLESIGSGGASSGGRSFSLTTPSVNVPAVPAASQPTPMMTPTPFSPMTVGVQPQPTGLARINRAAAPTDPFADTNAHLKRAQLLDLLGEA